MVYPGCGRSIYTRVVYICIYQGGVYTGYPPWSSLYIRGTHHGPRYTPGYLSPVRIYHPDTSHRCVYTTRVSLTVVYIPGIPHRGVHPGCVPLSVLYPGVPLSVLYPGVYRLLFPGVYRLLFPGVYRLLFPGDGREACYIGDYRGL